MKGIINILLNIEWALWAKFIGAILSILGIYLSAKWKNFLNEVKDVVIKYYKAKSIHSDKGTEISPKEMEEIFKELIEAIEAGKPFFNKSPKDKAIKEVSNG